MHDEDKKVAGHKISEPSAPLSLDRQREILMELYRSTNGSGWRKKDNWGSTRPFRDWHGVKCDGSGHVTTLALGGNELRGRSQISKGNLWLTS